MIVIAFWRLKSESFRFQPLFAFFILVIGCISYFGPSASAHAEPGCMSVVEHVMAEPPPPHEDDVIVSCPVEVAPRESATI